MCWMREWPWLFRVAASSPRPAARWCETRLQGAACCPWARPGDGSRTASPWPSIPQTTPRRRKTQAAGSPGVSRTGGKVSDFMKRSFPKTAAGVIVSLLQQLCTVNYSLWGEDRDWSQRFLHTLQPWRQSAKNSVTGTKWEKTLVSVFKLQNEKKKEWRK